MGFLGQDGIVRNQFAGLGQIDEVPNARRQELIHLLAGLGDICVPRIFASQEFTRVDPICIWVGSRRGCIGHDQILAAIEPVATGMSWEGRPPCRPTIFVVVEPNK
jgi:hypothetical protein